jgi:hypothetical protein
LRFSRRWVFRMWSPVLLIFSSLFYDFVRNSDYVAGVAKLTGHRSRKWSFSAAGKQQTYVDWMTLSSAQQVFLPHLRSPGNYCNCKTVDLRYFEDFTRLQLLWLSKKWFLERRPFVWMYARLANPLTVGRILFIFGIQEFIHHRSVSGEYEHSSSKNRAPSNAPPPKNCQYLEKSSNHFE